jgi:tRNA (guanine-N7-)-methyltransferase
MPLEVAHAVHAARLAALRAELAVQVTKQATLTLEIGCGHGHFLAAYAAAPAQVGEFCVGVDILPDRLLRAARKTERVGLAARFAWVRAEATLFLEALDAEGAATRFGRVFILFPDPWPKRRHWKNRLMQPTFLSALAARMAQGAELCFRSDHTHYFHYAQACAAMHPCFALASDAVAAWPFEEPTVFQARAEEAAKGHRSFVARRTPAPVPLVPPAAPDPNGLPGAPRPGEAAEK